MTTDPSHSEPDQRPRRDFLDKHRPRYHLTAPSGWLNDPNGLIDWGGAYHLFFQYNPVSPHHHAINWGHVRSDDLVHWTDLPIALHPDTLADAEGCWSGVVVNDDGRPTAIYSGRRGDTEVPCLARGSADLKTWVKDDGNPIIPGSPAGLDVVAFRDHSVWRERGLWYQLIGSGIRGIGGAALLYKSADLHTWEYAGPFLTGDAAGDQDDPAWPATMWECVDYFRSDDSADGHVLVFSAWHEGRTLHPLYWQGRRRGDRFIPSRLGRVDLGNRFFYAPQSMSDSHGRRVMFGWLQEGRPQDDIDNAGWSGAMSLPRIVGRTHDGTLSFTPAPEVASLRRGRLASHQDILRSGVATRRVRRVDQADLELEAELSPGATLRIELLTSDRSGESTVISVDRRPTGELGVTGDLRRASLVRGTSRATRAGDVPDLGSTISLRILVDRSVIELFVNGVAMSLRSYPDADDADGFEARIIGGAGTIRSFDAWQMDSVFEGSAVLA